MSAYVKKIAVIKQVKSGFSADGGNLSGLVKAETYAGFLKVEVSLINFAPLTEGRYVFGISDGLTNIVFEGLNYEAESKIDLSAGFAFLVCFCHNKVAPVASAACGQMACALPDLKEFMDKGETHVKTGGAAYDDEAISEVNYYERQFDEGGNAVRQSEKKEEKGSADSQDEANSRPVQSKKKISVNVGNGSAGHGGGENITDREREVSGNSAIAQAVRKAEEEKGAADDLSGGTAGGLAGGNFYSRMKGEIEKIFATYPAVEELESVMEGSRFAKIFYGDGKFYVFGVLTEEGKPRYVCYGVPAKNGENPPAGFTQNSTYIPCKQGGYWLLYQDADTGVSVAVENA